MQRLTHTLPLTLYRIQPRLPVYLRPWHEQRAKGRTSFDLVLRGGFVHPLPRGAHFHTPNGMSLRPPGT